jgi:hypothetical protein
MLAYYHANGNPNDATVQFEYQEMKETIRMEADASKNSSYIDFVKTRGNLWRLAILISLGIISQYSGNALFSNYINLVYEGAGITSQNQKMAVSVEFRQMPQSLTYISLPVVNVSWRWLSLSTLLP